MSTSLLKPLFLSGGGGPITAADIADPENLTAFVSVKNYGAVGDGEADDTAKIQATITAAKAANLPIYIPAGTYKISSTLTLDWEGATLFGDSGSAFGAASKIVTTSTTATVIKVPADYNRVRILNLYIAGPGRATSTGYGIEMRGDLGGATNIDFSEIDGCSVIGFGTGIYYRGVANSLVIKTATSNCNLGIHSLGNNNSNTFQNCAFVCADGVISGTLGIKLAAVGVGSTILNCDMGGPTLEMCVENSSNNLTVIGGNWECYGSGINMLAPSAVCGTRIRQFGTASNTRWSAIVATSGSLNDCVLEILNSANGSAIKMGSSISRQLVVSGDVKADYYEGGVYNSTVLVGNGFPTMTMNAGEAASANNHGIIWRRVVTGSNDVLNYGARRADGVTFDWANLLAYHYDKQAGTAAAWTGLVNTFSASQAIGGAAIVAPSLRIWAGTDVTQNRQIFGLVTAANQYALGTDTRDAVLQAQAGGDLLFLTGTSGVNQTVRGRIKDSGVLNMAATPVYADNAAAIAGGLVAGDEYRTSTGVKMEVYTP